MQRFEHADHHHARRHHDDEPTGRG
jgi:hypothetical protein